MKKSKIILCCAVVLLIAAVFFPFTSTQAVSGSGAVLNHCTLVYSEDFSYAVVGLDENLYFINNGADIPYARLPIDWKI